MEDIKIIIRENSDETVDELMGQSGILSKYIDSYQEREPQIDAVKKIIKALNNRESFIFEGPTGFGKSPTYITSLMLHMLQTGKRAIIGTAGIVLQEQLYFKDIPAINEAIKELGIGEIKYAYLKGRANFLCHRKLALVELTTEKKDREDELNNLVDWSKKTTTGDNSELDYVPKYKNWSEVACLTPEECEGKKCPNYDFCFYQRAKIKALSADLLVTNYHMLLSDYNAENNILGEYELLVCDEAHELPKIARDFSEIKVSFNTFRDIQRRLTMIKNRYDKLIDISRFNIGDLLTYAAKFFDEVYKKSEDLIPPKSKTFVFNPNIKLGSEAFRLNIAYFSNNIDYVADEMIQRADSTGNEDYSDIAIELGRIYNICDATLATLSTIDNGKYGNRVYYLERVDDHDSIYIKAKYVKVGEYLRNLFTPFKEIFNFIITSATLSVSNSFSYIKSELGIDEVENVGELIASSPFDLSEQQLWYLPRNATEGNASNFIEVSTENIIEIIKACKGGVLALFTSNYNMDKACYEARRRLRGSVIYKQGDAPKQVLLEAFKNNKDSILFATRSFFTGVDIKGKSLRCVIVDKFPFESPTDPVTVALNKEQNAFFKYSIPDMVITLKQAFGRGVRDTEDKCVIALLDNRLATARYKGRINTSFDYKKTATRDIEDVKKYVKEYLEIREYDNGQ